MSITLALTIQSTEEFKCIVWIDVETIKAMSPKSSQLKLINEDDVKSSDLLNHHHSHH